MATAQIHFGGPGHPPGALRDRLAERIEAAPSGSTIDIVTYYFRDRRLAAGLVAAQQRGVRVRVTIEANPRLPGANDSVIALLSHGLGAGFRALSHRRHPALAQLPHPRLHEKLYLFSQPRAAFIGSFNPSSDVPELDPASIDAIGDHDRGYNSLVESGDPALCDGLAKHAAIVHRCRHGIGERLRSWGEPVSSRDTEIHFWPRLAANPITRLLRGLGRGDRARIAASHLSGPRLPRVLAAAARRGARVEIVSHASVRRFPPSAQRRLEAAGVVLRRLGDETRAPMHEKFALFEGRNGELAVFGSLNWTEQSHLLNHEIAALCRAPEVLDAYQKRWSELTQ